jgi:hypothetical protein
MIQRGKSVANMKTITTQVLDVLQRNQTCEFDLLVHDCSEFTWRQLFYEVDRLSRLGQLCLYPVGEGHYFLRLPQKEDSPQANATESQTEIGAVQSHKADNPER